MSWGVDYVNGGAMYPGGYGLTGIPAQYLKNYFDPQWTNRYDGDKDGQPDGPKACMDTVAPFFHSAHGHDLKYPGRGKDEKPADFARRWMQEAGLPHGDSRSLYKFLNHFMPKCCDIQEPFQFDKFIKHICDGGTAVAGGGSAIGHFRHFKAYIVERDTLVCDDPAGVFDFKSGKFVDKTNGHNVEYSVKDIEKMYHDFKPTRCILSTEKLKG